MDDLCCGRRESNAKAKSPISCEGMELRSDNEQMEAPGHRIGVNSRQQSKSFLSTPIDPGLQLVIDAWSLLTRLRNVAEAQRRKAMTEPERAKPIDLAPTESLSELAAPSGAKRLRLPDTRRSVTHKFNISGHEGYVIVGFFENDQPGEVFLKVAKQGSTVRGLMDTIGVLTSLALQYSVPIEALAEKFEFQRFEPSGWTSNPEIGHARSITDYVFRWLGCQFSDEYRNSHPPLKATGSSHTAKGAHTSDIEPS